jgi:hypothetical protein
MRRRLSHDEGGGRRAVRPAKHADAMRIETATQARRQRSVFGIGVAPGGEVLGSRRPVRRTVAPSWPAVILPPRAGSDTIA